MSVTGRVPEPPQAADERLVRLVHDLRTPLTVVTGFCELLERQSDKLTEEQKQDYLHRVVAAAHDLRDILDRDRDQRSSES